MSYTYMLDTNICSFIIRERPPSVLDRLQAAAANRRRMVISAITYWEFLLGVIGRKASPRHARLVEAFVVRLSEVLSWDRRAAEASALIHKRLAAEGTPIGRNDTMIAGHAVASNCVLVTNNLREFLRVPGLQVEDWTQEL